MNPPIFLASHPPLHVPNSHKAVSKTDSLNQFLKHKSLLISHLIFWHDVLAYLNV